MTRVYARSNPDRIGVIVSDAPDDDVIVEWEDDGFYQRYRIARAALVVLPGDEPAHTLQLQLLDAVDRFRDAMLLAIECIERDIRRTMKED